MYVPKVQPWAHQEEALSKLEGKKAFALLMAMRTGKTKTILDDYGRLELDGEVQNLLIIAPASLAWTWKTAAEEHLSDDLLERVKITVWEAKSKIEAKDLRKTSQPKILIVNVEALSSVMRARGLCAHFLSLAPAMLVIDESTTIKNPSAKRTRFVTKVLKPLAPYRRILSGLPAPKCPLDIYAQFNFLDYRIIGIESFWRFRNRYAITQKMLIGKRYVDIVVGYRNTDELASKIAPHSYRIRLEDCYDLPPKMYSMRHVTLTDEQKRIYKSLKEKATAELDSGEHMTATHKVVQILRMHQVLCGHATTEEGEHEEIPENRTKVLLELLEEHDGKAVIWCSYDADVRKIAEKIGEGAACFWGGNRSSREAEEKRFMTDPECTRMVSTAAAGGRGRRWDIADLVIYYSNTLDLEHRVQSEERTQGVGKAQSVMYVDLVVPGTIDEKIIAGLRKKIDIASIITGDDYREWLI